MKRFISIVTVVLLTLPLFGADAASLGGRVLGLDGQPAPGFQVVLLSTAGEELLSAGTDQGGTFLFDDLEPGSYEIGIRSPEGDVAPVLAEPTDIDPGERVIREIHLQVLESPLQIAPARGVGVWWAGLSRGAKVWTVMGTLVGVGLVYSALEDDDSPPSVTAFRID